MAWDDAARNMAVNVIAKVEGAGAWDAINYRDPITIGLMQWYGTRAAGLLRMIKNQRPEEYGKIANTIRLNMNNWDDNSKNWTLRWLSVEEGSTIKPVLRACKDIQSQLVASDVDDYKDVCDRIGLDVENNTNTAIFFMVMYHQTPQRALNVLGVAGKNSTLDRLYQTCINFNVFSNYKGRYREARDYIASGAPPNIIDLNDDNESVGDDGGGGGSNGIGADDNGLESVFDSVLSGISYIKMQGAQLVIQLSEGSTMLAHKDGAGNYTLSATRKGVDVDEATPAPEESDDTPSPDPDPPTGDEEEDIRNALVKFMTDRVGRYGYSQDASRRLQPDKTGVTDCSALVRYAFLSIVKKDVGTYTDAQLSSGTTRMITQGGGGDTPNMSLLKKGDLIISRRYNTAANRRASHVEMYMGGGRCIGHGGVPYMGPVTKDVANHVRDKQKWYVKRLNSL